MTTELVSVPTSTTPLDGLIYTPEDDRPTDAALLMHGNGMNFYSGALRFLPPVLLERGITSLAFNRHGHDTVSCSTREPEGNAYQTAAQAISDNECAAAFLAGRGYGAPVVIGHSNGGMLAAHYVASHPETPALVLLSAHCGGDEMLRRASANGLLGGDRLPELLATAHELVAQGRGGELLILPGWFYVTTAASLVDMETNTPVLVEDARSITCPVLFIRGSEEDRDIYPAEAFASACRGDVDVRIIDDCNHFYQGHEDEVATIVADWLEKTLGR